MSRTSTDQEQSHRVGKEDAASAEQYDSEPSGGIPSEMQRQMEAAKARMQKYHAVYKPAPEEPDA